MSGQSVMDRVIAAKHSIAGAGLAKSVCKATTEEIIGPKKKHLDYLVHCTNEPNVSIPQMADLLFERTQHNNWVVVFKSLISIHNLMNYGNERFSQYFASNNCSFNLGSFMDKSGVHGYDMSTFVRRYAKYLNAKSLSYRTMAYDFCKVKRGKDDGLLRTMSAEKLLKTIPPLQSQLDSLIEFDCTPNELTNGVMNACFMLLFKDLIRLFACYNDGIINLLEKYFDMNKKQCKDGLEIYKRFLVRMEKVSEFLKVAENVGIDKGDIPDLAKAPSSLLQALEEHYEFLENKKGTAPAKPAGFASALNTMTATNIPVSDEEKTKILNEENKQFEEFKKKKELTTPVTSAASTNPFLTSPTHPVTVSNNLDLFGAPIAAQTLTNGTTGKSSDDLLSLNTNPFQQNIENVMAQTNAQPGFGAGSAWGSSAPDGSTNTFASDNSFAAAFGAQQVNGTHSGISKPPPGVAETDTNDPIRESLDDEGGETLIYKSPFDTSRCTSPAPPVDLSLFGVSPDLHIPPKPEVIDEPAEPLGPPPPIPLRVVPSPVKAPPVAEPDLTANLLDISLSASPKHEVDSNVSLLEDIGVPPGAGMASTIGGNYGQDPGIIHGVGYETGYDSQKLFGGPVPQPGAGFIGQLPMGGVGGVAQDITSLSHQQINAYPQPPFGSPGAQLPMGSPCSHKPQSGAAPPFQDLVDHSQVRNYGISGMSGSMTKPMSVPGSPMRSGIIPGSPGMSASPVMMGSQSNIRPHLSQSYHIGGASPMKDPNVGGSHIMPNQSMAFSGHINQPLMAGMPGLQNPIGSYMPNPQSVMPGGSDAFTGLSIGQGTPPIKKSDPLEGFDSFGDLLQPQNKVTPEKKETRKLIASDLDTSMMQLAGSLNIKGSDQIKKTEHQWQPKSDQRLTGGSNWQQPLTSGTTWSSQAPYIQQQQMMGAVPRMQYSAGMAPMGAQAPYMGMTPNMGMMPNTMGAAPMPGYNQPVMMGALHQQTRMPQQTQVNDPFGSL